MFEHGKQWVIMPGRVKVTAVRFTESRYRIRHSKGTLRVALGRYRFNVVTAGA